MLRETASCLVEVSSLNCDGNTSARRTSGPLGWSSSSKGDCSVKRVYPEKLALVGVRTFPHSGETTGEPDVKDETSSIVTAGGGVKMKGECRSKLRSMLDLEVSKGVGRGVDE